MPRGMLGSSYTRCRRRRRRRASVWLTPRRDRAPSGSHPVFRRHDPYAGALAAQECMRAGPSPRAALADRSRPRGTQSEPQALFACVPSTPPRRQLGGIVSGWYPVLHDQPVVRGERGLVWDALTHPPCRTHVRTTTRRYDASASYRRIAFACSLCGFHAWPSSTCSATHYHGYSNGNLPPGNWIVGVQLLRRERLHQQERARDLRDTASERTSPSTLAPALDGVVRLRGRLHGSLVVRSRRRTRASRLEWRSALSGPLPPSTWTDGFRLQDHEQGTSPGGSFSRCRI